MAAPHCIRVELKRVTERERRLRNVGKSEKESRIGEGVEKRSAREDGREELGY